MSLPPYLPEPAPIADLRQNGLITRPWLLALQALYNQVAAAIASITLTGDVTGTSTTGTVATTIANDAVTYAKMQNVSAASRLLGRGSAGGAGNVEELTISTGLTLTGTVLSATGSGGTVTSVSGTAPIASSGGATPVISHNDTAVTPGSYTNTSLTVDQKGHITAASSGAGASIAPLQLTGANEVEQYNSTNLQTFRWYSTRTSSSVYQRLTLEFGGTGNRIALFKMQAAGGGVVNGVDFWSEDVRVYDVTGSSSGGNINALRFRTTTGTFEIDSSTVNMQSAAIFKWSNDGTSGGTKDTGIARNAAGVVEINSGTAGTFRDVLARALRSNAVTFANRPGTPVEGMLVAFTDSTTAAWGATITGTGANHVLGYYNGTNWTVAAA